MLSTELNVPLTVTPRYIDVQMDRSGPHPSNSRPHSSRPHPYLANRVRKLPGILRPRLAMDSGRARGPFPATHESILDPSTTRGGVRGRPDLRHERRAVKLFV